MSDDTPHAPFWRSKTGVGLLVFLGIAAVLLTAEHWAHLAGTLPLLLLLVICLGMLLFMYGGHGDGGSHPNPKE